MADPLLVIFDCDGVLVDSEIIAAAVETEMLQGQGIEIEASDFATRFAGLTWPTIMQRLAEETGTRFPKDFAARVDAEIDRRLESEVEEIPGAREAIERLTLPRCICSNSSTHRLELMLDRVGLWDAFVPNVFSATEVGAKKGKPAPDVFLYACEQFSVPPKASIVIEDSVHGVAGATAAGCRVVGFTGGQHSYAGHAEQLAEAGAETVISRLADFPAVVEALAIWSDA
ncbi:MAG: HAD family phosphatase [Aurantimonas endophytica]|uniref:HAD superfamily hydrolase (TIGR01509 family) n=1 Tax=Aurantimonas endophytica TaxID=1522175 RepID=A0A7W6HD25_9HYPH|nr:HAD family phosphatase [Aurantimonas endophytica]MBB4002999.1 HAD superfamily hydrolase (TIGR01509 family) [Aurantimonas endophytica]MCO6403874.1 HAD-IA family hydrolase [Aurantimonas endophytica]